jgi:hypothetical protein
MFKPEDFEIIDMHVHPFETPSQAIGAYTTEKTMDEFDAEMRRAGVDRYAGGVAEKGDPNDFKWIEHLNRTALRLRDRFPNYIPGIHVHGSFVEESCAELHKMKPEGVILVGELVPYMLGTGVFDSEGMLEIFREMSKLDMIANLHHVTQQEAETLVRKVPQLVKIFDLDTFHSYNSHIYHPNQPETVSQIPRPISLIVPQTDLAASATS